MGVPLFRSEALAFQRTRAWVGAAMLLPLATWVLTLCVAASIALAIAVLVLGTHGRKETVPGYLPRSADIATVLPASPGTVTELEVGDGAIVTAGQFLLRVHVARGGATGQSVDTAVIERLEAKRDAIAQNIAIEQRVAEQQAQSLTDALTGLEAEVTRLAESSHTMKARVRVAHDQATSVVPTGVQGAPSATELQRRTDTELSLQQASTELYRQIAMKAVDVREKRRALAQLAARIADHLAVLQSSILDIEAGIAEARGKQDYVVSAPVSGRIDSLRAWIGMNVQTGIPLMSIVPAGAPLEASP